MTIDDLIEAIATYVRFPTNRQVYEALCRAIREAGGVYDFYRSLDTLNDLSTALQGARS